MKRFLLIAQFLILPTFLFAQRQVTEFLGIPVDGDLPSMNEKLKNKGFVYLKNYNHGTVSKLEGEFNGQDVYVFVWTNNNKVFRIALEEKKCLNTSQTIFRYNQLIRQFKSNPKYKEKYAKEITDNYIFKEYQAHFSQTPFDNQMDNRLVWIRISPQQGCGWVYSYKIEINYDNEFNKARGEDL